MKKNYRLICSQKFMGKILRDVIMKYDKTVAEMEEAVNDLYSDPCVFEVWYEGGGGMREEKYTDMSLTGEQASLLGFKSLSEPEQYIQVNDTRYTLDEFNRIGDYLLGRKLNENQQIVLEWLKKDVEKYRNISNSVGQLTYFAVTPVGKAWGNLSTKQQYQVLAAFAEWGMKEVAE